MSLSHRWRASYVGLVALASASALALSACGGQTTGQQDQSSGAAAAKGQNVRMWVMEGSFSDGAVEYLEKTFAEEHPGNTLSIEVQPWDGIVQKLQTSLASASESPDLVETGNTQTSTFSSVGAFAPIGDLYEEVGGDKLIQSFVEAGTWDDTLYSLPLYAGARGVFYRKDLFEAAGINVPQTIDEFAQAAVKLGQANPEGVEGFSGMYLAAVDVHGVGSLLFAGGGDWAEKTNGTWKEKLSDAKTIDALTRIKDIFNGGTAYALDSQASQKSFEKYFNEGKVGMLIGTGNIGTKIDQSLWDANKVGVMPIPGSSAGNAGKTFAGGSLISMSANSHNPELAKDVLKLIYSERFQRMIGEEGWVPGNTQYSDSVQGAFGDIAGDIVEVSKLTPNTPQWGVASGNNVIRDFWTAIAQNDDVASVAAEYGAILENTLNSK